MSRPPTRSLAGKPTLNETGILRTDNQKALRYVRFNSDKAQRPSAHEPTAESQEII